MKNFLRLSVLTIILTGFSFEAMAVTGTGTASLKIVVPLSIVETNSLRFGSFSAGSGGTINQNGSTTGGVIAYPSSRGAATLTVSGDSSATWDYILSIPSDAILTNGAETMTTTITYTSLNSLKIVSGSDTITVNGVLTVDANQSPGTYNGTYTVTVQY